MADPPAIVSWELPSEDHESPFPGDDRRLPLAFCEHARVLWIRFSGTRWIVSTTAREAFDEDFGREQSASMTGASSYPLRVKSMFGFKLITPENYGRMAYQSFVLAPILGGVGSLEPVGFVGAVWVFSDTRSDHCGSRVGASLASRLAQIRVGGHVSILETDTPSGRQTTAMTHTFWILGSLDGISRRNCATTEEIAWRILHLQEAILEDPRDPDFGGVDFYVQQACVRTSVAATPQFIESVGAVPLAEALIMKSIRLWQDEWDVAGRFNESRADRPINRVDTEDDES
jgi:hypothetical protein